MAIRPYRKLPPSPIKGMNCPPPSYQSQSPYTDIPAMWNDFILRGSGSTYPGIFDQIDLAVSAGANQIRIIGDSFNGVWQTPQLYSIDTYVARQKIVASYCQSKGVCYYPTLGSTNAPQIADQAGIFAEIASKTAQIAAAMRPFPHIWGMDVMQEFDAVYLRGSLIRPDGSALTMTEATTRNLLQQVLAACRAVAPELSYTASAANHTFDSGCWTTDSVAYYADLFDHIDIHLYHNAVANESQAIYGVLSNYPGAPSGHYPVHGKLIMIGETGAVEGSGQSNRTAQFNALMTNVVNATYPGQPGVVGFNYWALVPQQTPAEGSGNDWGIFDSTGAPRSYISSPYVAVPASPWSASLSHRRRRAQ